MLNLPGGKKRWLWDCESRQARLGIANSRTHEIRSESVWHSLFGLLGDRVFLNVNFCCLEISGPSGAYCRRRLDAL